MANEVQVTSFSAWIDAMETIKFRPDLADVTFIVGENQHCIYGCRAVLAARSRIMHDILYKSEPGSLETKFYFPEFTFDEFSEVLDFVQCGRCVLSSKTLVGVWIASIDFRLQSLQDICEDFLSRNLTVDNVCYMIHAFQRFAMYPLARTVEARLLNYLKANAEDIFQTTSVAIFTREELVTILRLPDLPVREYTKFVAAVNWTRAHYNVKIHSNPSIAFAPFLSAISLTRIPIRMLIENVRRTKLVPEEVLAYACAHNHMKEDFSQESHYESSSLKQRIAMDILGDKTTGFETLCTSSHVTKGPTGLAKKLRGKSFFEISVPLGSSNSRNMLMTKQISKSTSSLEGLL